MGKLIKIVSSFNSFAMGWTAEGGHQYGVDVLYYDPERKEYVLRREVRNDAKERWVAAEERFTNFIPPAKRYVCDKYRDCVFCRLYYMCPDYTDTAFYSIYEDEEE